MAGPSIVHLILTRGRYTVQYMIRGHVGQMIGTVEEATVPGRAVHRPAYTYKRSLYMSRGHVGQLIGTVDEAAVPE